MSTKFTYKISFADSGFDLRGLTIDLAQRDESIYGDSLSVRPEQTVLEPSNIKVIGRPKGDPDENLPTVLLPLGPEFEKDKYALRSNESAGPATFANSFMTRLAAETSKKVQQCASASLCESCNLIPLGKLLESEAFQHSWMENLAQLRESAISCTLCNVFLDSLPAELEDISDIKIFLKDNSLHTNIAGKEYTCPLELYADPGTEAAKKGVSVGLPFLSKPGSDMQFQIIREWLGYCEAQHACYVPPNDLETELPTRVIDVGSPNDENIRLFVSKGSRGRYIALSHKWGTSRPMRTLRGNIDKLSERIDFTHLPKTFQDVVLVTRKLGIRYLWIDSLCIVQDDEEDWRREAQQMANIFRQAYCTIAAASASGSSDGFLNPRTERRWFKLSDKEDDNPTYLYASEVVANFNRDVVDGPLNERAWVFQERTLSSRIIHFTTEQIYLECGYGCICENMTYSFKPLTLLGSCRFPEPNPGYPRRTKESAFEETFTKFTTLAITFESDRPLAVAGLEQRLAQFYGTESTYGIVHAFLARSLFWNRAGAKRLKHIKFLEAHPVPSWSWMAYHGKIQYGCSQLKVNVDWDANIQLKPTNVYGAKNGQNLKLEGKILTGAENLSIKSREGTSDCGIQDVDGQLVGWMRYDVEDERELANVQFVPLAKQNGETRDRIPWKNFANAWGFEGDLIPGNLRYLLAVSGKPLRRFGVAVIQSDHLSSLDTAQVTDVL